MGVACSLAVQYWVEGDGWTTISGDTLAIEGLQIAYGITGNGPLDVCASVGTLAFALNNKASNSGGAQGYYSPLHGSARANWDYGRLVRVVFTYSAVEYVKFYGKLTAIDPEPGAYGSQRVFVQAADGISDLLHASVRSLDLLTTADETELLDEVLTAIPSESQPPDKDMDDALDTFPYAFDQARGNQWALPLIRDIVQSVNGLFFVTGDGTMRYINRVNRSTTASSASLSNTMHGLESATTLSGVFNRVRVILHKKSISATATEALYVQPTGASQPVKHGETVEVWVDYTDPNDRQTRVGGSEVVTTLADPTHYTAEYEDGSPAVITVTLTPFASTAKWTLTNDGATLLPVYVSGMTVIGKALRDLGPVSYEASASQYYGERALSIDLLYQSSEEVARGMAQWIADQYGAIGSQISAIEFIANDSDALMTQAMAREPGDAVTITETVTGAAAVKCIIHSVALDVSEPAWVRCRWGLAPAAPWSMWSLGTTGYTELGETTTLGF